MSSKNSLLASHRSQLAELETEMDEEAREELEKLRDDMAGKIRSQITNVRHKLHADLNNKGKEFWCKQSSTQTFFSYGHFRK